MKSIEAFRLGYDPMPDWFMDEVTANRVVLHNDDDRHRGGPDEAHILPGSTWQVIAVKGDYIVRGEAEEFLLPLDDLLCEAIVPVLFPPHRQHTRGPARNCEGAAAAGSSGGSGARDRAQREALGVRRRSDRG